MPQKVFLTTDGSCNSDRMRCGYVIRSADSGDIISTGSKSLGRGTSNMAEYLAIIEGCKAVLLHPQCTNGTGGIVVYTDSQLVVRQLKGAYRVRSAKLRVLHAETVHWLTKLRAKIIWHPRDEGDGPLADALATGHPQEETDGIGNQVDEGGYREEVAG